MPDEGVVRGLRINRLDHALLGGIDLDDNVRLLTEVLGFDLSEKLVDADSGQSWRCSELAHDIASVLQPEPALPSASTPARVGYQCYPSADMIGKYRMPRSMSDRTATASPVARRSISSILPETAMRCSAAVARSSGFADPRLGYFQLGSALFSQDNRVRESFLNVLT